VELAVFDGGDQLARTVFDEANVDLWMSALIDREQVRHRRLDELRRCPDTQRTALSSAERSRALLKRLGFRQHASTPSEHFAGIEAEDDPSADPIE